MTEFYSMRLSRHLKKMMKYMRYIFNDHFVLVCVFLVGALGFYYSETLKTLPEGFVYGRPILFLFWLFILPIGKLATLSQEADKVFILPKETEMNGYLLRAVRYSCLVPMVLLFLVSGISMPLVVVSTDYTFSAFLFYFVLLALTKVSHLLLQKYQLFQISSKDHWLWYGIWLGSTAFIIGISLYFLPIVGLVLSAVQAIFFYLFLSKLEARVSLDWEGMILKERARMHRIYQFIHLFTDVPEITSSVKRRKILDPYLNTIKKKTENTYLYLYARSFARGSEYSGLFLRLLIVGCIVLFFLKEFLLSLAIALLFIYLIGFQLIPIYAQFDYMVMTHLYPVPRNQKKKAVSQLMVALLFVAAIFYGIAVLIALPNKLEALMVLGALFVEVVIFTKFYVPYRLKKMED